jgi:GMP synthase (glutamine-hydrolysing)
MVPRIAVLQHERETGPGAFAALLSRAPVKHELVKTTGGLLPDADAFDGAIALGGSLNTYDPKLLETRRWIRNAALHGLPFLGVCLGGQLLASALGAVIERQPRPEFGVHDIYLTDAAKRDPLFADLPGRLAVFGWHEDCFDLPPGAVPLAGSIACTCQAFRFGEVAYGLQFHSEVRAADLGGWVGLPGYLSLFERATGQQAVARDLQRVTPALDALAEQLLGHWLDLVSHVAESRL